MKKIYLSVFLFGLTTLTFAQKQELSVKKAKTKMEVSETMKPRPVSSNIDKVDLWTSDFSNPTDWAIGNNATGNGAADNWVIGTAGPAGAFAIDPIASTTASNGFALFDSDLLCSADQSAWIGNATPIDLSAAPGVTLQFESFYRKYTDQIFVQVSTDNSTWIDFPINASYNGNDISPNPQVISLNITTAIASNPSTVYFRFLFLSDASNGGDGCDYAWMIDDVKVSEAAGNDIVVQKAFTHDIIEAYDYSIMPASQLVPMVVGVELYNIGGTAAVQAPMTVVINDGTSDVYNQTTNFDLGIGVTDTLWVNTGFTPVPDKTYTITFTAPADDVLTNNVSTPVSYQTTQTTYAQDFTTTGIYRFDRDDETSMGNIFEIVNAASLTAASVKFETGTTAPYARIMLSRFHPTHATYNSVQAMEFIDEFQYTIASTVIGNGQFTEIAFPTPVSLEAGWYYVLEVRKDVAADRIFLGGSANGDDDLSTVGYGPFGTASAVNYFISWGFSPAIRMSFGVQTPVITSNDTDNVSCIGSSITLSSSLASGVQWNLNGSAISGANSQTYAATQAGNYTATVGGLTSNELTLTFNDCTGINEGDLVNIAIYPNPTTGTFTVTNTAGVNSIELVDQLGRTLASWKVNQVVMNLDVTKIAQGNYTLVFKGDNASTVKQVQIAK